MRPVPASISAPCRASQHLTDAMKLFSGPVAVAFIGLILSGLSASIETVMGIDLYCFLPFGFTAVIWFGINLYRYKKQLNTEREREEIDNNWTR
jgi:hypothetical protein